MREKAVRRKTEWQSNRSQQVKEKSSAGFLFAKKAGSEDRNEAEVLELGKK